jgi:hypothetical protein
MGGARTEIEKVLDGVLWCRRGRSRKDGESGLKAYFNYIMGNSS